MASYDDELSSSRSGGPRRPTDAPSQRARGRAIGFMLIALVAGLASAWMAVRQLRMRSGGPAAMTRIAVAAVEIPRATTLRGELLTFVEWPTHALPQGAVTEEKAKSLDGRVLARELGKGEPVLETRLAQPGTGIGMAAVLPENMRAMTVKVNEVIGVAGFIHPDDYVDIITTMSTALDGSGDEIRAKIILQGVKVLAVGQEMVTQNSKPVKVPVVTLLVSPEQSERLALATTHGKVQLTLRSAADVNALDTRGISPPDLFGKQTPKVDVAATPKPSRDRVAQVVPKGDVVEVLRGDRYEERKLRPTEAK